MLNNSAFQYVPTPSPDHMFVDQDYEPEPEDEWENNATFTKHRDTYPFIDPSRFRNALCGKVVLITLAHRGIGRATAVAFAQAGASICLLGPSSKILSPVINEIKEKHNTPTLALGCDILSPNTPTQIVALVEKHLGLVDILINITPPGYLRPFAQEPNLTTDWWSSLEENLRAPIALIHAVLPSMISRRSGTIISTVSVAAVRDIIFLSSTGVAKTALLKFHQQLDAEVRDKGVYSYAVNPGLIPSHLHDPDVKGVILDEGEVGSDPRVQNMMKMAVGGLWAAAGLASGTFVALAVDPRARCLSGRYVNAERDLGEVIEEMEKDGGMEDREGLYRLKVKEF